MTLVDVTQCLPVRNGKSIPVRAALYDGGARRSIRALSDQRAPFDGESDKLFEECMIQELQAVSFAGYTFPTPARRLQFVAELHWLAQIPLRPKALPHSSTPGREDARSYTSKIAFKAVPMLEVAHSLGVHRSTARFIHRLPQSAFDRGGGSIATLRQSAGHFISTTPTNRQLEALQQLDESEVSSSGTPAPAQGPLALFKARQKQGLYRPDPRQAAVLEMLQQLYNQLLKMYPHRRRPSGLTLVDNVGTTQPKTSWWSSIAAVTDPHLGHARVGENPDRPLGLYMWGGVGVGKTMLMDVFVESAPREFKLKRVHFHDFMLDVHSRLRQYAREQDPLLRVADAISTETRVLCLDELFVNDVADAMILGRLFERLWNRGLTLVATSNRRPDKLYERGLQRQLFMPFIHRLERECIVHDMDSVTDYRQLATKTVGVYFVRFREGQTNDDRLELTFDQITQSAAETATEIDVAMGRKLKVPRAVGKACAFTFEQLCGQALGPSDYLALVQNFHTIALKGVPVFNGSNKTLAYRFVSLIDVMYDHRTKLLISAEDYSAALFSNIVTYEGSKTAPKSADMVVDDNLGFAKDRTVSRLTEMQTWEYAIAHAERYAPELLLALREAQERCRKAPSKRLQYG